MMGEVWHFLDGKLTYEEVLRLCKTKFGREPEWVHFDTWRLLWAVGWTEEGMSVGLPRATSTTSAQSVVGCGSGAETEK